MLTLNHVLIGAVGGEVVKNSPVAFVLGAGIHFIFDKIPHFWPKEKKYQALIIGADTVLSVSALLFFWLSPIFPKSVFWGALGGASIDAILVLMPWFHQSIIGQWHSKRQPHRTEWVFWAYDFALIAACLFVLWRFA